jgi:hypothetical protein
MNAIATAIGWCAIGLVAVLIVAVLVGKLIAHRRARTIEVEAWDPAPRTLTAPRVPPQQPWRPSDTDLDDPREDPRDTPPA